MNVLPKMVFVECETGKVPYVSAAEADNHALKLERASEAKFRYTAYKCRQCHMYHVGKSYR